MPAQAIEFGPNRPCCVQRIARVAPKSEVASAHPAAKAIGEAERFRCLRERNAVRSGGNIPIRIVLAPFVRNAGANFSTKRIEIELEIGPLAPEVRQIDGEQLKIQTAGEIYSSYA